MQLSPSEAIKALYRSIQRGSLLITPSFVAHDLANTRRAYQSDALFANAILAVTNEIVRICASPEKHGIALDHDLTGWRRIKFCAFGEPEPKLRIIYRILPNGRIELRAFGHRDYPDSVYFTAANRN